MNTNPAETTNGVHRTRRNGSPRKGGSSTQFCCDGCNKQFRLTKQPSCNSGVCPICGGSLATLHAAPLGDLIEEYTANPVTFVAFLLIGLPFLVFSGVGLVAGFSEGSLLTVLLSFAGAIFAIGFLGYFTVTPSATCYSVYEKGLEMRRFHRSETFRFDQIVESYGFDLDGYPRPSALYRFVARTDGRNRTLSFFSTTARADQLAARVQASAFPFQLQRAINRLNAKKPVRFGKLQANRIGLHGDGWSIPWANVEALSIHRVVSRYEKMDFLVISQKSGGYGDIELSAREVCNIPLLNALIQLNRD